MYPIADFYIMLADIVFVIFFVARNWKKGKRKLIDKMFTLMALALLIWQVSVLLMYHREPTDMRTLFICDAISNIGVAILPPSTLFVALAFTKRLKLKRAKYLLIPPLVSIFLVMTNPLHGLYYQTFSIYAKDIVFGRYFYVQGIYGYLCLFSTLIVILKGALKSNNKTYRRQGLLFSLSIMAPFIVNITATFSIIDLSIAATPLAFTATLLCQAAAIYWLGFLNLTPIVLQRIAESVSDAYMVLDDDRCVYSFNKNFLDTFAVRYHLTTGQSLDAVCPAVNNENRAFLYALKSAVDSAQRTRGNITYEQTIVSEGRKRYFVVEVTALISGVDLSGYLALFKDVTRLREAMQIEQENLNRSMERERLASLGQMIGGIAHNLKTPIMSIAGSANMLDSLVEEYKISIGDSEVTAEDYRAICDEMADWLVKIKSCCSYMSDIITTVKGLATNMNTSETREFTVDELMKRVQLLLQHELKHGKCHLLFHNELPDTMSITGDVNNMVQVVSNLVSNAVDAMPEGGDITVRAYQIKNQIRLSVKDCGTGVPPHVKNKLFKEMFTSKGLKGTGLGLYMSAALMRGKFNGELWLEDTSAQGSEFCLFIPRPKSEEEAEQDA